MNATLTELRRQTSKVVRPVIHRGEKVILTQHGEECARIVPARKIDRRAAAQALIEIGPVEFLPRK
jgi:prevent-host-death family protein